MNVTNRSSYEYYVFDYWRETGNPKVYNWPLMSDGPWKITSVVLVYIFCAITGPKLMKNRKAYECKTLIYWYNVLNIATNGLYFIAGLVLYNFLIDTWKCTRIPKYEEGWREKLILYAGYWYMWTKLLDFGDTLFFILRKKSNQVTFLHVSHHAIMPYPMWLGMHLKVNHYMLFMPLANCFVHTIMYTYYLLASYGEHMKPYLWWKKYLTQIQIVQFVLVFIHAVRGVFNTSCGYPTFLASMQAIYSFYFFFMFSHFYVKTYRKERADKLKKST